MSDLQEIWGKRFLHYMKEVQRYTQFIFTGHLAIVLVFAIGAAGYAYSEWLKDVSPDFPAAIIVAVVLAGALVFSSPTTLIKEADMVFFLPLEKQLQGYVKRALRWSILSQLPLPFILYIVSLPLLSATKVASTAVLLWLALFILVFKWIFVENEFSVHLSRRGEGIWQDRLIRFILGASFIYLWLSPFKFFIFIPAIGLAVYTAYLQKLKEQKPFPYEHFISLEQNRMMRFYQFANYFTDVPHLKGAVKPRKWLNFLMKSPSFEGGDSQAFLVKRTYIRTDDIFWLWVRLTVISMAGAYFLSIPVAVILFVGALAYASSIQLIFALRSGGEFRMDMLFPESTRTREKAIVQLVRRAQFLQAIFVFIPGLIVFKFSIVVLLIGVAIVAISELTIRSAIKKKSD